jgi:hemerythrin-like domain-containing protein/rubredoxin
MNPIGILMKEHRLIERIIPPLKNQLNKISVTETNLDPKLIENAVKFFINYTDHTHHGKEENILFRELEKKELSQSATHTMNQLIEGHSFARDTVDKLQDANNRYIMGEKESIPIIRKCLMDLTLFYPNHIAKEDETFFPPIMAYFNIEEQDKMVQEFWRYDKTIIDTGYRNIIEEVSMYFNDLTRWVCTACGYIYDPETASVEEGGFNAPFQELPPEFLCPVCFSPKQSFEKQFTI